MTTNQQNRKEDHLDRFNDVVKGLNLSKEIANKLANFIHFEVMSAKKSTRQAAAKEAYAQGFNDAANTAKKAMLALTPVVSAPCCESSTKKAKEEIMEEVEDFFNQQRLDNQTTSMMRSSRSIEFTKLLDDLLVDLKNELLKQLTTK